MWAEPLPGGSPEGQSHNKGWIMLRRCRLSDGWSGAGPAVWDGGKELLAALFKMSCGDVRGVTEADDAG